MHNFKIFIEALEALPEDVKSNKFHHLGMDEPELNKPHDFGGLISIVAVNTSLFLLFSCVLCLIGTSKPRINGVGGFM
jgi:hypothetical protein